MTTRGLVEKIERRASVRSAWKMGVKRYALDIVYKMEDGFPEGTVIANEELEKFMLLGAEDWTRYSEGGFAFIHDEDIARRVCTCGEYRKFLAGKLEKPNKDETWLSLQARALQQAGNMIINFVWDDDLTVGNVETRGAEPTRWLSWL